MFILSEMSSTLSTAGLREYDLELGRIQEAYLAKVNLSLRYPFGKFDPSHRRSRKYDAKKGLYMEANIGFAF